jgi:MinD-like ATPase involved in chromosome partitioning or flagellar assembly
MPVEDFDKYMKLAQVLDTSWGTGSQVKAGTTQSIKFNLRDDKLLKCNFMMIVTMPNSPTTAIEMKRRFKEQALQMIKASLEKIKESYEKVADGKTIKLSMIDNSVVEGIEYLSNAQYRPALPAYFRLQCLVEVD